MKKSLSSALLSDNTLGRSVLRESALALRRTKAAARLLTRRVRGRKHEVPQIDPVDRTHTIEVGDDYDLEVLDIGPLDAPTTVLCAHGFTLSAQSWIFQVEHLRERPGLRLLIPDLRGHAHSIRRPGDYDEAANTLSIDATGEDLVEILRQLHKGENIVLLGHSMGVMTVLAALRQMDEDLYEQVRGAVLINGAIDTFASAGIAQALASLPVKALRRGVKHLPSFLAQAQVGMEWLLKPVIAAGVYYGALEEGESGKFDVVDFHAKEIDRTPMSTVFGYLDDLLLHDEKESADRLRGLPGIVLVGERDDVTPASQSRAIHEVWEGSRLVEFADAGHMLPVETPEKVNKEIDRLLDDLGI